MTNEVPQVLTQTPGGSTLSFRLGDSRYYVDGAYRVGVSHYRAGVPYHCNPYRPGSTRHSQWSYGHEHASDATLPDGI